MTAKRIILNGEPVDFTCQNYSYQTDISEPTNQKYPGSVSKEPIYDDGFNSILILEKVINIKDGNRCYWFMWYQYDGQPLLTMSGVISADDIREVLKNISKISFEK